MISFKPRVGKVQTGQTSGGFTVIIHFIYYMMYYSLIILVFNMYVYIYIYIVIYIIILGLDLGLVHSLYYIRSDGNIYLKMNMCHNFNTLDQSLTIMLSSIIYLLF